MTSPYSRTNPFPAKMVVNRRLNEGNRNKETRHHEISLAGSGLTFEPGDSMAVCATNDPPLVEEVIRAIGATGD
jgi:sulfite reductase (NADPH) flavoprotein alpha-component